MAIFYPSIIYGTAPIAGLGEEEVSATLSTLKKHSITSLDSGHAYASIVHLKFRTPQALITVAARKRSHAWSDGCIKGVYGPYQNPSTQSWYSFPAKNTRWHGKEPRRLEGGLGVPIEPLRLEKVLTAYYQKVDLYYLFTPDPVNPIEETLSAIQELHAAGKFKRFGLSNYLPHDVQKIHSIQSAASSILPTIYQGNYNAAARHPKTDLFPLLCKLHIHFYAYSPIAGDFLAKTTAQLRSNDKIEGRF